jgi:hypothetical protein
MGKDNISVVILKLFKLNREHYIMSLYCVSEDQMMQQLNVKEFGKL